MGNRAPTQVVPLPDVRLADVMGHAVEGDQDAWDALVERFTGLLWSVARAHRLGTADAADVMQTCWLRLIENLDRVREPDRVGAWLATTARHESLKSLRRNARQVPSEEEALEGQDDRTPGPEAWVVATDRDSLLRQSLEQITQPCQVLLRVLTATPPPSYLEVSAALAMPVGSIGPTRARCLEQLRKELTRFGLSKTDIGP